MREIINISLPPKTVLAVRRAVKNGGYASVSEFFRELLRNWKEYKLYFELRRSEKEVRMGKAKLLTSYEDLEQ